LTVQRLTVLPLKPPLVNNNDLLYPQCARQAAGKPVF